MWYMLFDMVMESWCYDRCCSLQGVLHDVRAWLVGIVGKSGGSNLDPLGCVQVVHRNPFVPSTREKIASETNT